VALAPGGLFVLKSAQGRLVFAEWLTDADGADIVDGTCVYGIEELQSDGTFKSYDFNDNTFKTTALTTPTASMTQATRNNATVNTGIWAAALTTLTGFTVNGIYSLLVTASPATGPGQSPTNRRRWFQYGGQDGDVPANFSLLVIDAAGIADANMVNAGPTGAGVAQSGGDIYEAVTNIAVTSAALNATSGSRTITTGTGSGGVANTTGADQVYDNIAQVTGAIDVYYQFDLSATENAVATSVQWIGYVAGLVNTLKMYAYNWGGASWDQLASIPGIAGTNNVAPVEADLTTAHTGTGGNAGLVRIRFQATGLTAATLKTDRLLLGYAVTPPTAGTIRDAILTDATRFAGANIDATISSRSTFAGGAVASVTGNVTGSVGSLAAQAQTDVQTAMTGQGYTTTRAGYLDTLNGLVAAIWNALTAGFVTVGSIGKLLLDNINATISSRSTLGGTAQTGDAYGALTGAQAEPAQGTPAANASPLSKISYLFKAWRNRTTQTAAAYKLYNDDAVTVDHKATFSDDTTTADRGEIASGP